MSNEDEIISDEMAAHIRASLAEDNLTHYSPEESVIILEQKWRGVQPENVLIASDYEWTVTFSDEFEKQTARLDKNVQGRILQAIIEVSKDPLTARGDTKKPLKGDRAGCWDYRTGGYRLIYKPDSGNKTIRLVTFGPRGDVYKK